MSNTEYTIKREDTFKTISSAVNKMVDLIRPTYGPASNKVIIDKPIYRMAVDDGVQIARDFELADPAENAVVRLVRETAITTNDRAGDGTTGALIMLQAIINEVRRKSKFNGRKIELELKAGLRDVKKYLKKNSTPIETKEDIKKVARISFDDEPIAEMIADLYHKLGRQGVITIDKSPTMQTTVERTDGTVIKSGYISPYMVTNPERMEAELTKPYILITDYRLTEANDLLPIMNKMAKEKVKNLLIIAENVEQHALATQVINLPHVVNPETRKPGSFMSVSVAAPKMNDRKQFLEDLALISGGKMFSQEKGDKLENIEVADLGRASKVIVKQDETVIVDPKGDKAEVGTAVSSLKLAIDNEPDKKKKDELNQRLARFTNSIAVIKVGASTEQEQKALKYKVEDAVHSVRSAYRGGVVCGSGQALASIKTSSPILNEALKYPSRQLRENMGLDEMDFKEGEAMNVVTGESGPFMEVGVVDPVNVLIAGVESAVSIASLLLTSSGMIVESQRVPKD